MRAALKIAGLFLALGLACGFASAQTSSATVTLSVTAAIAPATVTIAPSATSVHAGTTATLNVTVAGPAGAAVPTGSVELFATAPGATAKVLINSFALTDGAVTCSYPVPATAPVGAYTLEMAYSGDGNYSKSPDFQ